MEDRGDRIWAEKNAEEEATFCYGTDIIQTQAFSDLRDGAMRKLTCRITHGIA